MRATNLQIQLIRCRYSIPEPGYAASITGRSLASLTLEEEARAVRDCFMKHATRKEQARSGLGLCNVVDILRDHGGFLRLRTGRQSLYADLASSGTRHTARFPTSANGRSPTMVRHRLPAR